MKQRRRTLEAAAIEMAAGLRAGVRERTAALAAARPATAVPPHAQPCPGRAGPMFL
ncbi:hypothetical protein OG321_00685 [Streptomyces sp. NBC_00424]|nr:hypothetical protein [Streptomyces sp. NBC_00424]